MRPGKILAGSPVVFLALLAVIGTNASVVAGSAGQAGGNAAVRVLMGQGLLTVEVRDAPLSEVLRTIAKRAGLKLTLRGDVSGLVSESFAGVSLDEGIRRLARGYSLGLVYNRSPSYPEDLRVTEVWVIGTGEAEQTSVAQNRRPSPIRVETSPQIQSAAESLEAQGIELSLEPNEPDRSLETTLQTIVALAREGGVRSASLLTEVLFRDEDPTVRGQAALALGQIGGDQVSLALRAALQDEAPSVRVQALQALALVEREQIGPTAAQILLSDPYWEARRTAARALGQLSDKDTLLALRKALLSESDESVRTDLKSALTRRDIQAKLTVAR